MTAGVTPSLNLGNVMTLEAWIKPTIVSGVRNTIITHRSVNVSGAWQFEVLNSSGFTGALYVNSSGSNHAITTTNAVTDGAWQHVAYVREGASGPQKIYVNGVVQTLGTDTPVAFVDNGNPIWIGGVNTAIGAAMREFNGIMDEVRIWNVARRQEDIQRDMYRELTGTENGLVGYWKFNENDGCTAYDNTNNNNDGTRDPTCPTSAPNWATDIPALNNDRPDLPPGTVTNSRGGWLYSGRAVANTDLTVRRVEYAVNGGSFLWATPTDGAFNANGENFEVLFQSNDNGNTKPGYLLDLKATDNTDKTGTRTHFEPFNLSSVRKLADGQLEFTFNVNKQRDLMKTRLDRYKILYSGDNFSDKLLLDDIVIDFETVRSRLQNEAQNSAGCDPCVYDNGKMKVSYLSNNSQLTVTTQKAPTLTGSAAFKVMAVNPDKFEQNSNSLTLESDSGQVKSATDQLTSAEEKTSGQGLNPPEGSTLKFPGQKTTFKETPLSGETGPIAGIVNGVIAAIMELFEKVKSII